VSEPVVIEPMMQKDTWDCGVVCLCMLLGVSYQDVRSKIRYRHPTGLSNHEIRRIAKSLGYPLRLSLKGADIDDIGVLLLERGEGDNSEGHAVLYVKGTLYNPAQGEWWTDVESYLKRSRYRVVGIFTRRDDEDVQAEKR